MAQKEVILSQTRSNYLQQALSWFTNLFRTSRIFALGLFSREIIPDIDAQRAISEGFDANAAVFSIVNDDADKFASIPRYVYDAKKYNKGSRLNYKIKAKKDSILNNDLSKLLERPNPWQGQAAFLKTIRSYYKICGEAFIWLNRGDVKDLDDRAIELLPILEMYVLPSHWINIVPDPANLWGVEGYILNVGGSLGGQKVPYHKAEIVHWRGINLQWDASLRSHLRGMPALKPGAATLQQNNEATRGATRMYSNDGSKAILYGKNIADITAAQETQLREVVDRKVNNNDVKGAVATLFGIGELGVVDLSKSSIDLELLKGKADSWKELCALLGVPYEFYNTETTFANKEQAQKGWVTNKIIPACKEFDDELNRKLLRAFKLEDRAIIASDASELPELQEDIAQMVTGLAAAWWLTPNQRLEMMGQENNSDPMFDEPWIPSGLTPLSQNQGDGFDALAGELGLSDYGVTKPQPDPAKNGQTQPNGKLNGAAK